MSDFNSLARSEEIGPVVITEDQKRRALAALARFDALDCAEALGLTA